MIAIERISCSFQVVVSRLVGIVWTGLDARLFPPSYLVPVQSEVEALFVLATYLEGMADKIGGLAIK